MNLKDEGYPPVMLVADMCRLMRRHENTLYRLIATGQVPKYQRTGIGQGRARYEWNRDDVETWLTHRRSTLRKVG